MKRIVFIGLFLCFFLSCTREEFSQIPYAPVRLDIDLNFEDKILIAETGYKTFVTPRTEAERGMLGYGGLIVCHGLLENSNSYNLWAFDLACPVEAQKNIRIVPDDPKNSGAAIHAKCPTCGAVFEITAGGVAVSGSKYNLTRYSISSLGNNRFRVTN